MDIIKISQEIKEKIILLQGLIDQIGQAGDIKAQTYCDYKKALELDGRLEPILAAGIENITRKASGQGTSLAKFPPSAPQSATRR